MLSTDNSQLFNYTRWKSQTTSLAHQFHNASPFPHIILDNFLPEAVASDLENTFPSKDSPKWLQYHHINERLLASTEMETEEDLVFQSVFNELNSDRFINWLSAITGIMNLKGDPTLEGGGMIRTDRGGYLNIHADFTVHPYHSNWRRRINLLYYLNHSWQDEYGGHLELWNKEMTHCVKKIAPRFNRAIIFYTDKHSHHGYPKPLSCPRDQARKSLGLYYYTLEPEMPKPIGTNYQSRPEDGIWQRTKIKVDRAFVNGYYHLKRYFGLNDDIGHKALRWLSSRRRSS